MSQQQNKPHVIWYFRALSTKQPPYHIKHRGLLKLIDDATRSDHITTIAITEYQALGDTESEFRESLKRIAEAELYLQVNRVIYHPRDLLNLKWRG